MTDVVTCSATVLELAEQRIAELEAEVVRLNQVAIDRQHLYDRTCREMKARIAELEIDQKRLEFLATHSYDICDVRGRSWVFMHYSGDTFRDVLDQAIKEQGDG